MSKTDRRWNEQLGRVPLGGQTLSKLPSKYVEGIYPRMVARGDGCVVEDYDGNCFTDYISALGPSILGYAHPKVNAAAIGAIKSGRVSLSFPNSRESDLAEIISSHNSSCEMTRFFKTGSDTLSAAVRVARAFTGRLNVAVCGYHGWHDWYAVSTDRTAGIPPELKRYIHHFKYNDLQSLKDVLDKGDFAAVIMEPVIFDAPHEGFLETVRNMADEAGALLIFDEVVTGLRFGLGGAGKYFNVSADLYCFSKALANGFPLGALSGRRDIMRTFERDDFFVSGTFGGELVSIEAAIATFIELASDKERNLKNLWRSGDHLRDQFNGIARGLDLEGVKARGYAPRVEFMFPSEAHKALFWQECAKGSVLFGYSNFCTTVHRLSAVDGSLNVVDASLRYVKEHWNDPTSVMEGKLPALTFKKQ